MNDSKKDGKKCRLCGKESQIPPEPTAISIQVETVAGEGLKVPGVYPLCLRCRKQVAHAERAARDGPREPPICFGGFGVNPVSECEGCSYQKECEQKR